MFKIIGLSAVFGAIVSKVIPGVVIVPSVPSTICVLSSPNTLPVTSPVMLIGYVAPSINPPDTSVPFTQPAPSYFNTCHTVGVLDVVSTSCSALIDLSDSIVASPGIQ